MTTIQPTGSLLYTHYNGFDWKNSRPFPNTEVHVGDRITLQQAARGLQVHLNDGLNAIVFKKTGYAYLRTEDQRILKLPYDVEVIALASLGYMAGLPKVGEFVERFLEPGKIGMVLRGGQNSTHVVFPGEKTQKFAAKDLKIVQAQIVPV